LNLWFNPLLCGIQELIMVRTATRGIIVMGLSVFVLAGCASKKVEAPTPEPVVEAPEAVIAPEPVVVKVLKSMVTRGKISVPMGDSLQELQGIFYFDFDQAIVKRDGHVELNRHANVMKSDSSLRARLEGHADERGTREYNLALGERRANAIRAYLVAQGVSSMQVEVISYGEEKPVSGGHNDASWVMNRRVEVVYR
jgi:peptidoglycan-associated lipoprotein